MKMASIVPISAIRHTYDGQYAMLLAHLVDYYPKCRNRNCYVIMDNSLIELGGAVDIMTVYKAAKKANANEFILPDVFQNGAATYESVLRSIYRLGLEGKLHDMRLMAVCQGRDRREFEWCFEKLETLNEIHCIGIPKVSATLDTINGRPGFEQMWQGSPKAIHLLGCWDSLQEFTRYKHPELVRSFDTCIPSLIARDRLRHLFVERPKRTIDFHKDKIDMNYYGAVLDACARNGWM